MDKTIIKVYTFEYLEKYQDCYYITKKNKIDCGYEGIRYIDEQLKIETISNSFDEMCEKVRQNVFNIADYKYNILARVDEVTLGYCGSVVRSNIFRYNSVKDKFEDMEI